MKIIFYSTNSNSYRGNDFITSHSPSWKTQLEEFASRHRELEICIATCTPGMFLLDLEGNELKQKAEGIQYIFLGAEDSEEIIAKKILETKADLAIAMSFYVKPYDWLGLKDALVAEKLRASGLKTICHSTYAQMNCFDKFRTHQVLEKIGVKAADYVYVHHNLFLCAGNKKDIQENVYQSYVMQKISSMNFPLVIKDTVGLSSYSMEVVETFGEAKNFLFSKKNSSDRLVEELVEGLQFGLEIHGTPGSYTVLDPFIFSVNKFGLTSPKQSIKIGPVDENLFGIRELKKEMLRMAEHLGLEGIAQVDLVYSKGQWYVIEINPRLSGMSTSYAAAMNQNFYDMVWNGANGKVSSQSGWTMNFKLPLLSKEDFERVSKIQKVIYLPQIQNMAATQEREKGYCEIIVGTFESCQELMEFFREFKNKEGSLVEEVFSQKALELFSTILEADKN